jgi:hypothetical protein
MPRFAIIFRLDKTQALVVVVYRYRKHFLGFVLTNYVFIEILFSSLGWEFGSERD